MTKFVDFSKVVANRFEEIVTSPTGVFRLDTTGSDLWIVYLEAFPEGTNNIVKERREYDCNCCKNALRDAANIVTIKDGKLLTLWDFDEGEVKEPFATVCAKLQEVLENAYIAKPFLNPEKRIGKARTVSMQGTPDEIYYNHFQFDLPKEFVNQNIGATLSPIMSAVDVFKGGLNNISTASLEIINDLIKENNIYRGEEHAVSVSSFLKIKQEYDGLETELEKNIFVWKNYKDKSIRFKNTVIGTLAEDLTKGVELEKAVKSFESKVAPANYKRPKKLVTQKMIDSAEATVLELGLEDSLARRHAHISDISIDNVLWANRDVQSVMKQSVFGNLKPNAKKDIIKMSNFDDMDEIPIEKFAAEIMPESGGKPMQVLMENHHSSNLVSLVTSVNEDSKNLFKWNNPFSWVYNGDVADSQVKELVEKAGGNVNAKVRISLAWYNTDDLDIHMVTPKGKQIYYGNKCGVLDVDMNAGGKMSTKPVENLAINSLEKGIYRVDVHNYSKRNDSDTGFIVEFETGDTFTTFEFSKPLGSKQKVLVATFESDGKTMWLKNIGDKMTSQDVSQSMWSLDSGQFVDVKSVMMSPNHWTPESGGNGQGNRHWFFALEGCANPDPIRGFFNEQLRNELTEHRKVFEVLGSQMKVDPVPAERQLSGLGFSSTKSNHIMVKLGNQMYKILI